MIAAHFETLVIGLFRRSVGAPLGAALLATCVSVFAQPGQPSPSAMIQLMMSQPSVDETLPVTATAVFDPPVVRLGEPSIYRVTFNSTEDSIHLPDTITSVPELTLERTARGSLTQQIGSALRSLTALNYEARAREAGDFTVPEMVVMVYGKPVTVPSARLQVRPGPPEERATVRRLQLEVAATNVFAGEPVGVRVLLPAGPNGAVEGLAQVQFNGEGFVVDKYSVRQSIQPLTRNNRREGTFIYEAKLTPIATGTLKLSAQAFSTGTPFGSPVLAMGQVGFPGGQPNYVLLETEPATIQVRPLPADRELPGFNGAIGRFLVGAPRLATNAVRVGEPVDLEVAFHGGQNINRLTPPKPPQVKDWQVFPAVPKGIAGGMGGMGAAAVFSYTMIPLNEASRATPAIPFSCFDPERGAYMDLTVPSVPITVIPNQLVTDAEAMAVGSNDNPEPDKKLALSPPAQAPGRAGRSSVPVQLRGWFPLAQLACAGLFSGLWFWDQRRRYLELHPEILRRRRARRDLRRARRLLSQAAARQDADGFIRGAIHAMQVASAPHYPAQPRALVGRDVLGVLNLVGQNGRAGETVSRFFAVGDAAAFSSGPSEPGALLGLRSDLDQVLEELESRL